MKEISKKAGTKHASKCGICILAGGLSQRIGQNKAALRVGSRTLLGHVRAQAMQLGLPVRMIRKDLVPRCGPLGGIYTALKTSRSRAEMFLACDMPFVSVCLLRRLFKFWELRGGPVFMSTGRRPGFPFLLPVEALPQIEAQIAKKEFSLQDLALGLEAGLLRARLEEKRELFNINTPADWRLAEERWRAGFACKSGL